MRPLKTLNFAHWYAFAFLNVFNQLYWWDEGDSVTSPVAFCIHVHAMTLCCESDSKLPRLWQRCCPKIHLRNGFDAWQPATVISGGKWWGHYDRWETGGERGTEGRNENKTRFATSTAIWYSAWNGRPGVKTQAQTDNWQTSAFFFFSSSNPTMQSRSGEPSQEVLETQRCEEASLQRGCQLLSSWNTCFCRADLFSDGFILSCSPSDEGFPSHPSPVICLSRCLSTLVAQLLLFNFLHPSCVPVSFPPPANLDSSRSHTSLF